METLSFRTRGEDIFVAAMNACIRNRLELKNLRDICTDGAPAMTDNKKKPLWQEFQNMCQKSMTISG